MVTFLDPLDWPRPLNVLPFKQEELTLFLVSFKLKCSNVLQSNPNWIDRSAATHWAVLTNRTGSVFIDRKRNNLIQTLQGGFFFSNLNEWTKYLVAISGYRSVPCKAFISGEPWLHLKSGWLWNRRTEENRILSFEELLLCSGCFLTSLFSTSWFGQ